MKNFLSVILFFISNIFCFGQYTDVINSNRPGETQTAYAVGRNVFQIEVGMYGIRDKFKNNRSTAHGFGTNYSFRFGYFKEELEFISELEHKISYFRAPLISANQSGLRNVTLGAKYLFYDPNKSLGEEKPNLFSYYEDKKFSWKKIIPAISVYAGANINYRNPYTFENDPGLSPKIMIIMQSNIIQRWVLVGNIIIDKITTEAPTYGGIFTVTRGIHERLTAFAEIKAIQSDFYSDGIFTTGAAWLVSDKMQLDASISKNIKNTPSLFYGGIGLSWRFDDYYEPVLIPLENEKEKELKKEMEQRKGKVEEIGGVVVPVEGEQDVDPENIKIDTEETDDLENDRRQKRKKKKKNLEDKPERTRKRNVPPAKEEPTVIDLKDVKRE